MPLDYPGRLEWTKRTEVAEQLGLFDASNAIGFRLNWDRLIESKGYRLINGEFLPLGNDGPGVAFVFADKELQQRFCVDRYRSSNIAQRLLSVSRPRVVRTPAERIARVQIERTSKRDAKFESLKPILEALWTPSPVMAGSAGTTNSLDGGAGAASAVTAALSGECGASTPK